LRQEYVHYLKVQSFWDSIRLAQNLAFSMLAMFLPLYLTKGMSNFYPATIKIISFSLFCWIQLRYAIAVIMIEWL
jgi:hypothetical protein